MTTAVMSEAQTATAYQRQLINAHRERQARFAAAAKRAKPPAANLNVKPEPTAEVILVQPAADEKKKCGRPLGWRKPQPPRLLVQHDSHVIAYREWLVVLGRFQEALAKGRTDVSLEELLSEARSRRPARAIIDEVLAKFPNVSLEQVKGTGRQRHVVRPRQLIMYELYQQRKDLSFPAIGRMLGGRDHTTVLHAVNKIKAELARQKDEQAAAE
jgi:hypothetical protein|uniref:Putative DNA replication initiation protein n=1 Tax=viral metagenome TaxID=1070528 RepID=A0A6H1ZBN8_9ZZZZ